MAASKIRLDQILAPCHGAYSARTIKGYRADLSIFIAWCRTRNIKRWLPARPDVVAQFVDDHAERYRISTIKRRLCAIAFAHQMRDLASPTDANAVRLAVRRANRLRVSRPQQKKGLTHDIRTRLLAACPDTLAGCRDAAVISVGYDTLCRSSELAAIRIEHLDLQRNGSRVLIPRTKSDVAGEGRIAHLSPMTSRYLRRWITTSQLSSGPLFRALHLDRISEGPLCTSSIRRIVKRALRHADYSPAEIGEISGHSMRIGAAQDMMVAGFDALAIMQAGGWKSTNVVLRYVENAASQELHEQRWQRLQTSGAKSVYAASRNKGAAKQKHVHPRT